MDTSSALPRTRSRSARWFRIGACLALLALGSATLAYLATWVQPVRPLHATVIQLDAAPGWPSGKSARSTFPDAFHVENKRRAIADALDSLAGEPTVVVLRGYAILAGESRVCLLPADASLDDESTWVPMATVLEKLRACPSKQKLLVVELMPLPSLVCSGWVDHDFAKSLSRDLEAIADDHRLVLSACAPGESAWDSAELGQSVFAHYVAEALRGHADGYGDTRDGRVTVKELAQFVQARVGRWTAHNRGAKQTPTLSGTGDFTLARVDVSAPHAQTVAPKQRSRPEDLWQGPDRAFRTGEYRLHPLAFQRMLALASRGEGDAALQRSPQTEPPRMVPDTTRRSFDESWRLLQHHLSEAKPADQERIKKRFIDESRTKHSPEDLDTLVFAQAAKEARLDPGALRLCDQLLHPTPNTAPRSAETARLRLLADLGMRIEVQAWPRDVVDALLRATATGERAMHAEPTLPNYVELLEEPAQMHHAGEIRLWSRGYSNLEDAKRRLTSAAERFERLERLNGQWRSCEESLDQALMELPWYLDALESIPEMRVPWQKSAASAKALADTLRDTPDPSLPCPIQIERYSTLLDVAGKHASELKQHLEALHGPLSDAVIDRLVRQCRSPNADAATLRSASAILTIASPLLREESRRSLHDAAALLSHRLCTDMLAIDRQENETQARTLALEAKHAVSEDAIQLAVLRAQWRLALLETAGVPEESLLPLRNKLERARKEASWSDFSEELQRVTTKVMAQQCEKETRWRERERLAWMMPPRSGQPDRSPTLAHRVRVRQDLARWLRDHQQYLARDYRGLPIESPGIMAARAFFAQAGESSSPSIRMQLVGSVQPLTEKLSYAHFELEVTRQVPAGAFGPVELSFQCADDVWLEVSPESASLPALKPAKEPRTQTHRVPLKAMRKPKAERTGLPPPLGFLVEARVEGRSYHHLVAIPIVPNTQELQLLVSAEPEEPATTLNEIRIRPGKVKQPHYVHVRNLTNRPQKFHVEFQAGDAVFYKSPKTLSVEPDAICKVSFGELDLRVPELRGPLVLRVLDATRQKVLDERSVRVEILTPDDYVQVAEATYDPAQSKWLAQVQASKQVAGPAISAQLVLPVQRIPGLLSVGGGTLQVELPTHTKTPRTLFAENLRLIPSTNEEGAVYLNIDGVPRALIYRTTFSRGGLPTQPTRDERPSVRLSTPPCVTSGVNLLVDIEVDNAPAGAKLEVALGRMLDDGTFKMELTRDYLDAKKRRIDLEAAKDALVFQASIADWTPRFDTQSIVGPRTLRARLVDPSGKEIVSAQQSIVLDNSPPVAKIVPTPAQVKKGTVLQVQAQGVDPDSGVAQVVFFLGKAEKGEIPPSVPRFKAAPMNREGTQWIASLPMPAEQKGPLTVSVQVVNHAGLASVDAVTIDVTDKEPGKTGLGEVQGRVVEGPRPQPNLTVVLMDAAGKEIARTRTLPDGSYRFDQVAPGRYRVLCVKPESQRRAVMDVNVEPDRPSRADLALVL